jgi:hypothetical protein
MSNKLKGSLALYAAAVVVLAVSVGCDKKSGEALPAPDVSATELTSPEPSAEPGEQSPPAKAPGPAGPTKAPAAPGGPAAPAWPSPEDCISYNPANVTVQYEAGFYTVADGSLVVMRLSGAPGENVGDKALALAKRYRKHCFLGRDNTREDKNSYVFDYWRNASGMTPAIPDQEDDCSPYDRGNLTVEDMGGGYGWRVKDHDHVLHLFDNQSDARNGKLVLSKYHQICSIGNSGDEDDPEFVSYSR